LARPPAHPCFRSVKPGSLGEEVSRRLTSRPWLVLVILFSFPGLLLVVPRMPVRLDGWAFFLYIMLLVRCFRTAVFCARSVGAQGPRQSERRMSFLDCAGPVSFNLFDSSSVRRILAPWLGLAGVLLVTRFPNQTVFL